MKLHLPVGLRTAVLSCFAVVSALSATLATATLTIGAFAATTYSAASAVVDVTWDDRWKVTTAPSKVEEMTTISLSADTLIGAPNSAYIIPATATTPAMAAVCVADTAIGSDGIRYGVEFYGGYADAATSLDTWIMFTKGSVAILAGGNSCYSATANFTAPANGTGSHILVDGGEIGFLIGGNYWDSNSSTFTGNSYITVRSGTVVSYIVGGSAGRSGESSFVGDTHIWIDTHLGSVKASDLGGSLTSNAIVAGNAAYAQEKPKVKHEGSSSLTINLSAYTGTETDFDRLIIGDAWLKEGATSTHTGGGSTVSITGKEGMKFSQNIIGGSYLSKSSTATLSGETSVSITNAACTALVMGGSHAIGDGVTSTQSGGIAMTLTDSSFSAAVIGTSLASYTSKHHVANGVSLSASGSTFSGRLIGGTYVDGLNSESAISGGIALTLTQKSTVGGYVAVAGFAAKTSSHEIDGGVKLTATDSTFSERLTGGVYVDSTGTGSQSDITGDIALTLTNSKLVKEVSGTGFIIASSTHMVDGDVTLTFAGTSSVGSHALAGFFINEGAAVKEATITGKTTLNLLGGMMAENTDGEKLSGGSLVGGSGTSAVAIAMGDIEVNVGSGTTGPTINRTLYGGSVSWRGAAEGSLIQHGDITLNLYAGSLESVYAAGMQSGSVTMTAKSTTVNIGSEVEFVSGAIVSGGYELGKDAANATVTGTRKLALNDAAGYTKLSGVAFENFDVIENASDVQLGSLSLDTGSFTKKGVGTLKLGDGTYDLSHPAAFSIPYTDSASLTVEAGRLEMTPFYISLQSITVGAGASLKIAVAPDAPIMLEVASALTLDLASAPLAGAIVELDGALDASDKLSLTLQNITASNFSGGQSYTLLEWAEAETAPLTLAQVDWINQPADPSYKLAIENHALVLRRDSEVWIWDGSSGSWNAGGYHWENAEGTAYDSTDSPDGKDLNFGTPGTATKEATVTIDAQVKPLLVTVNNEAGSAYTFAAASTGGIADQGEGKLASLMKGGEGTLRIENANTYSGGTLLAAGTLQAANATALGSGEVQLAGGRLELEASVGNAIVLEGGTLAYTKDKLSTYLDRLSAASTLTSADIKLENSVEVEGTPTLQDMTVTWQTRELPEPKDGNATDKGWEGIFDTNLVFSGKGSLDVVVEEGMEATIGKPHIAEYGIAGTTITIEEDVTFKLSCKGTDNVDNAVVLDSSLLGTGTFATSGPGYLLINGDNAGFEGVMDLGAHSVMFGSGTSTGGTSTVIRMAGTHVKTKEGHDVSDPTAEDITINAGEVHLVAGTETSWGNGSVTHDHAHYTVNGALTGSGKLVSTEWNELSFMGDLSGFTGAISGREERLGTWNFTAGSEGARSYKSAGYTGDIFGAGVTLGEAGHITLRFDYDNASLNLNAVVSRYSRLVQDGSGELALTAMNTAAPKDDEHAQTTGDLAINSGSVALGSAADQGRWNGHIVVNQGGTLRLVNGVLGPKAQISGSGKVKVDVAKDCTVDFGGNAGSLITEAVTIGTGATLTGVDGDIRDKVLNLGINTANIGQGMAAAKYLVDFDDTASTLGSETADIRLTFDTDAVVALLAKHKEAEALSYLTLTDGKLLVADDYSNILFNGSAQVFGLLGVRLQGVEGGSIVLNGLVSGVYIAGPGNDPVTVSDGAIFDTYKAVAVMAGQKLQVNLDSDPAEQNASATINNLVGASGSSLLVTNGAQLPASAPAVITLNNSSVDGVPAENSGPNTTFEGGITGEGDVEFVKAGSGTLTVNGAFNAGKLTAQQGAIKLNGGGDLDTLAIADAGKVELGAGTVKVGAIEDTAVAGAAGAGISIAEGGVLELDGATTTLDDANMKIYGPGTVKVGLGSTLTLEQAGQLDDVILELAGPGKSRALAVGTLDIGATTQDVAQLKGTGTVTAAGGTLTVTGQGGSYGGQLKGYGTLKVGAKAQQSFTGSFSPAADWDLTNEGTMTLDLDRGLVGGQPLTLGALTLGSGSTTTISLNTDDGTAGIPLTLTSLDVQAGASLTLTSTGETVLETEGETIYLGRVGQKGDPTSYKVGDVADITLDTGCTAFMLVDAAATKLRVDELGRLVVNVVLDTSNQLTPKATTGNGKAGAELLWDAALHHVVHKDSLMEDLLGSIMQMPAGDAADEAMAAVAGAGTAVLGQALAGDVERQLRAIRNRTTTMGVNQAVVNEDMPYFNAWINAEGDYHKTESDGTAPGYELSSWGGTVGFDVDCSESLTLGLALTAMYGDLEADSVDRAKGDMDTYYVSAFARANSGRWVHSFVGTVGKMEGTLDRTVNYGNGTYRTQGETQGMGFGFMYEVGYTIPMDEDATCCLQPIANVTWRHAAIDAYDEEGSDCGLAVDEQSYDAVTLGLGARVQAVVGENLYNRTSIFEARALAKFDLGDREGESEVALLGCDEYKTRVKGSELGAVGVEAGMGLTVPMGGGNSSLFFDASVEYRASYLNANGTVGYRVNF